MYAAYRGFLSVVEYLIEAGADVNVALGNGHAAHTWASPAIMPLSIMTAYT